MDPRPSFVQKFSSFLPFLEIIAILVSVVGVVFVVLHLPGGHELAMVGLSFLACIYFISSSLLPPIPESDKDRNAPKGFVDLFLRTFLRKIIYIGCSVSVIGLLFTLLKLNGSHELTSIAASVLGACCVLSVLAVFINSNNLLFLKAPLARAIPLLLITLLLIYPQTFS